MSLPTGKRDSQGYAYLLFHSEALDPAPNATWIIGGDGSSETYAILHYDLAGSRG